MAQSLRVARPAEAGPDTTCAICLEPASTRAWRRLACGHGFHEGCILRWVQHAHHAHCPMCRGDLESSALIEFEKDFQGLENDLGVWNNAPGEQYHHLNLALVGAERCRRRIYDAALVRFLKLLNAPHCERGLAQEIRALVNEMLQILHQMREVLERRRGGRTACKVAGRYRLEGCVCGAGCAALEGEMLNLLAVELSESHALLKRLSIAGESDRSPREGELSASSPLDAQVCSEVCSDMREHLDRIGKLCQKYFERAPSMSRIGGA